MRAAETGSWRELAERNARLSGALLAHLEFALDALESAQRVIPKYQTPTRAKIERRIAEIRAMLARHPGTALTDEERCGAPAAANVEAAS